MKLVQLEPNVFEDTETKTKFTLFGLEGAVTEENVLKHIENFKKQRIEVLLAKYFNGGKYDVLCGQLLK